MAFENLLTYTEVDSGGDLTVDSGQSIVFDGNSTESNTYVQHTDGAQEKIEFYLNGTLVASISQK